MLSYIHNNSGVKANNDGDVSHAAESYHNVSLDHSNDDYYDDVYDNDFVYIGNKGIDDYYHTDRLLLLRLSSGSYIV